MTSTDTTTTAAPVAPAESADEWAAKIERLRNRPPAEKWLTIPDDEAVQLVQEARANLFRARGIARDKAPGDGLSRAEVDAFVDDDDDVRAAASLLEQAITAAADAETVFHFRALPSDVYDGLVGEFPATEEQEAAGIGYNVEQYVPALIARCSVKPLTADQVADLIYPRTEVDPDTQETVEIPAPFAHGDVAAMVQVCRDLNEKPRLMLGKGSRPTGS